MFIGCVGGGGRSRLRTSPQLPREASNRPVIRICISGWPNANPAFLGPAHQPIRNLAGFENEGAELLGGIFPVDGRGA